MAIPKQNNNADSSSISADKGQGESSSLVRRKAHQSKQALPRPSRRAKRNKRRQRKKMLFLTMVLLLLIAGGGFYLFKNTPEASAVSLPEKKVIPYYEVNDGYKVVSQLSEEDVQEARKVALAYFNSADAAEASSYILGDSDRFQEYYQPLVKSQAQFAFSHGLVYENGAKSAVFKLSLEQGPSMELHAFAHPGEDFRVEWRSLFLLEGDLTLGEIQPLDTPQRIKVYVTPNGFYTPEFSKEEYQSLLFQNYTRQIQFPAFVLKDSEVSRELAKAFQASPFKLGNRLMLRATVTVVKKGKGYLIKELHSSDWTNLETYR